MHFLMANGHTVCLQGIEWSMHFLMAKKGTIHVQEIRLVGAMAQVAAAFQERFLPRVVIALKKEVKRLSSSDALISVDMAHMGEEEGNARAAASGGEADDEGRAARKSEKVGNAEHNGRRDPLWVAFSLCRDEGNQTSDMP